MYHPSLDLPWGAIGGAAPIAPTGTIPLHLSSVEGK